MGLIAFAIWRRRELSNGAVLLGIFGGLALAIVSGTELVDAVLEVFAFERGNGERILGLAVFAIAILFLLVLRALTVSARQGPAALGAARGARLGGVPERQAARSASSDKVAVVIPAYNEADSVAAVIEQIPQGGLRDRDLGAGRRRRLARRHQRRRRPRRRGRRPPRDQPRRRRGAAHRLPADVGVGRARSSSPSTPTASTCPTEMERLVKPIVDDEVDMAHGSRVLGEADPNSRSRELGIVFFNRVVSFITRTKVSDCSNGYRAVRTTVLPQLVLRQEQFHTSEFMIEAIKRGIPAKEVPVTVQKRLHGHSKKPAVVRYGLGFTNAIVRTWLR